MSEYVLANAGDHQARIVHVAICGWQKNKPYKGTPRPDTPKIWITYELLDQQREYEGEKKNLWLRGFNFEPMNYYTKGDRSTFVQLMNTFGVSSAEELTGLPCIVKVKHNQGKGQHEGKTFANFDSVSSWPSFAGECPAPQNEPVFYDAFNHDEQAFQKLPKYLQEYIAQSETFKQKDDEDTSSQDEVWADPADLDDDIPF